MKKLLIILITAVAVLLIFSFSKSSDYDESKNVSPSSFLEYYEENPGTVIDVRTESEFNAGHLAITDALYDFRSGEFHDAIENLDKEDTYYIYCRTGNRSGQAAELMREKGFKHVYNIGGFNDLAATGLEAIKID